MRELSEVIGLVNEAGVAIMDVYGGRIKAKRKQDRSPVTEADLRAHRILVDGLRKLTPEIPVLSEESPNVAAFGVREHWQEFWLVDPLDGTKEFLKRNGQFTVNVALVRAGRPVAGVVYAPAMDVLYYTTSDGGASKVNSDGAPVTLKRRTPPDGETLVIVGSRSHPSCEMTTFLAEQKKRYPRVQFLAMGSSLKICLVADGQADVYPRFGPTMEWDTAAAHAVANAAGCRVLRHDSDEELVYNKPDLRNPWFIVTPGPPASS